VREPGDAGVAARGPAPLEYPSREPWLVIDPKGLAGERAYETAAFLRNKADIEADTTALAQRRIAQMSEVMGVDRQRVLLWAFAAGVLSALWTFEDHGEIGEANLVLPRALRGLV
jgi:streptomycin 6-kinase